MSRFGWGGEGMAPYPEHEWLGREENFKEEERLHAQNYIQVQY